MQHFGKQVEDKNSDPNCGIPAEEKRLSSRASARTQLGRNQGLSQSRVSGQMGPLKASVITAEPTHEPELEEYSYDGSRDRDDYKFDDGRIEHGAFWEKKNPSPVEQDTPPVTSGQCPPEVHAILKMIRDRAGSNAVDAAVEEYRKKLVADTECKLNVSEDGQGQLGVHTLRSLLGQMKDTFTSIKNLLAGLETIKREQERLRAIMASTGSELDGSENERRLFEVHALKEWDSFGTHADTLAAAEKNLARLKSISIH
jgi:hypothetical protein